MSILLFGIERMDWKNLIWLDEVPLSKTLEIIIHGGLLIDLEIQKK